MIASLGKILQRFEDSVGARIDGYRGDIAPGNGPVLIEDKERALGESVSVAERSVKLRHSAFRFEVSSSGKWSLRSRENAAWHQTPSTEIPRSSALNRWN